MGDVEIFYAVIFRYCTAEAAELLALFLSCHWEAPFKEDLFPVFGAAAVVLEPLGVLQFGIGGRAVYYQLSEGIAYYYITVH